jgi:multidrug efflux pump subunit AcrA (membrane-fusion protein)
MSEGQQEPQFHNFDDGGSSNTLRNVLLGIVAVYIIFSLYFSYSLNTRLNSLETKQTEAEQKLNKKIAVAESELAASNADLNKQVGLTQKQSAARAAELARQQKASESRLTEEQQKQQAALGAVSGDVAGVKTELTGAKTDITSTKSDLDATKAKLDRTIGDLGMQSGLIATTREDLEVLKHKGDRNYFEFTLKKSKTPQPVSTVSLQLKKADKKKGTFTLNVIADDSTIPKKDKTKGEPLQFYTGRDRLLYELVVFTVDKDQVTGYISTPKNAPAPLNR